MPALTRRLDLNALLDLQAVLEAGSVTGAAQRLHLSVPAMSRRLARLREAIGDPLLVPAGRQLVPTARALALQPRIATLLDDVRRVLSPQQVDLATVARTFTLRASDGFVGAWSARLAARVAREAPGVVLRFAPRADKDPGPLRRGEVDLDLGVPPSAGTGTTATAGGTASPGGTELLHEPLFRAGFVGVVRHGHPLGRPRRASLASLVAWPHVSASRRARADGPLGAALAGLGDALEVRLHVPGFQAALSVAAASDLVAIVPEPYARWAAASMPLHVFALPVATPEVEVMMTWHARQDADPVHRWLRTQVAATCAARRITRPA